MNRLKQLRKSRKMSQAELAKEVGMSYRTMRRNRNRVTKHKDLNTAVALLLASLIINVGTLVSVVNRPVKPIVLYKADNAVVMHGKITGKQVIGKLYTLDCGAYGKFLVTKEQYNSVNVGDDIPSYLKGRGQ